MTRHLIIKQRHSALPILSQAHLMKPQKLVKNIVELFNVVPCCAPEISPEGGPC